MLEPHGRHLLLESLRPPDGFELDFAIATTFTLDLLSLLTAPLGFTFFELTGDASEAATSIDPLVLLRTIRRYADRMAIFCQAGRIAVPRKQHLLYANLEQAVVEVHAPRAGGVFHPKAWVLRFKGATPEVRYRLICLSRNLTFDRSWDTSLILDGTVADRQRGIGPNKPLADFIAALPTLAVRRAVAPQIAAMAQTAVDELRRVVFELPDGFDEYAFWALGLKGYSKSPFEYKADRRLVISPFLSAPALGTLSEERGKHVLVSRLDALQGLERDQLGRFSDVYVLNPTADTGITSEDGDATDATAVAGLHAKVYVEDRGWNASVFTGSANATTAALKHNVELLVELIGKKSVCGVEAVLGSADEEGSLRSLLVPYDPLDTPVLPDTVAQQLEAASDKLRLGLAGVPWVARVADTEGGFALSLSPENGALPEFGEGEAARCWPISLADTWACPIGEREAIRFEPISFEAITAFFAFEISVQAGASESTVRFVVNARLSGAPADRAERLLRSQLHSPQQLVRFLLLLLTSDDPSKTPPAVAPEHVDVGNGPTRVPQTESLLEPMLHALAEDPAMLDQVARTLDELRSDQGVHQAIPPGLDRIWRGIWSARELLRTRGGEDARR